jgi:DNA-binding GntR family transcriptional regulator
MPPHAVATSTCAALLPGEATFYPDPAPHQHLTYGSERGGPERLPVVKGVLPKLNKTAARRLAKQTGADLEDVLTLREVLEVGAAERAAVNRHDDADAKHLTACLHDCENATDLAEYRRLDSRFHLAVAEVAGSPSLTAAVAKSRMRVNGFLDAIPLIERNVAHSETQHTKIVAAIIAGDREAARRAMAEHLSATAALLRGFLG